MIKPPVVNCPQCGEAVVWDKSSKFRPFCSERCKLLDLGQWATDSYRVPEEEPRQEDSRSPDEY
ncbi:DNA gyrase inhibitor YacG [Nitrosomonas sp.]|uniref:DNA gyrase inhibitor YacG n=1 Tax=Nitrosomonas sp. TaxID=42353 RepID=UPI0025D61E81|nr:DNA gyrase inhibitor YacG [Nitrosomonas sp.]MCC6916831.1 DNA gyrase inhibitor YacG [Nitrosomonas sp.]